MICRDVPFSCLIVIICFPLSFSLSVSVSTVSHIVLNQFWFYLIYFLYFVYFLFSFLNSYLHYFLSSTLGLFCFLASWRKYNLIILYCSFLTQAFKTIYFLLRNVLAHTFCNIFIFFIIAVLSIFYYTARWSSHTNMYTFIFLTLSCSITSDQT